MKPADILDLPYIQFVIGMYDAPSVDYKKKGSNSDTVTEPTTAEQEIAAISSIFK